MREYELKVDEALFNGLSPLDNTPFNVPYLEECLGFVCGRGMLEPYIPLTGELTEAESVLTTHAVSTLLPTTILPTTPAPTTSIPTVTTIPVTSEIPTTDILTTPPFDHGPGPDEGSLTYDPLTDTGYYGLITSGDFISGSGLASAIGLMSGVLQNNTTPWMKFYSHGKVLFIPQKPIRSSVSWTDVYNLGAVFGTGDFGPYNPGSNVIQDTTVVISSREYIVRLITCAKENPFPEISDNEWKCTDNVGQGSEWNELMYRIHEDSPNCSNINEGVLLGPATVRHGGAQVGSNWATFTDEDLITYYIYGDGSVTFGQEVRELGINNAVSRGYGGIGYFYCHDMSVGNSFFGYRPVLELIQSV